MTDDLSIAIHIFAMRIGLKIYNLSLWIGDVSILLKIYEIYFACYNLEPKVSYSML